MQTYRLFLSYQWNCSIFLFISLYKHNTALQKVAKTTRRTISIKKESKKNLKKIEKNLRDWKIPFFFVPNIEREDMKVIESEKYRRSTMASQSEVVQSGKNDLSKFDFTNYLKELI